MTAELVFYEVGDNIGFVTLNRPEKLNALSTGLKRELAAASRQADDDAETSIVVPRGPGAAFAWGMISPPESRQTNPGAMTR